jgi:hypothetical protein
MTLKQLISALAMTLVTAYAFSQKQLKLNEFLFLVNKPKDTLTKKLLSKGYIISFEKSDTSAFSEYTSKLSVRTDIYYSTKLSNSGQNVLHDNSSMIQCTFFQTWDSSFTKRDSETQGDLLYLTTVDSLQYTELTERLWREGFSYVETVYNQPVYRKARRINDSINEWTVLRHRRGEYGLPGKPYLYSVRISSLQLPNSVK